MLHTYAVRFDRKVLGFWVGMVYGASTCCHTWQWCADVDGHPHPEQGPGVNIRVRSPRRGTSRVAPPPQTPWQFMEPAARTRRTHRSALRQASRECRPHRLGCPSLVAGGGDPRARIDPAVA